MDAVRRIYREEGLRAFFRGLSVSYLGLTETAIQFTCYDIFKRKLGDNPSKLQLFGTAAAAKLIATTLTYPHEVVRTRMRERTEGKEYATLISSFKNLYKQSGCRGLRGPCVENRS
ncbi:mitochondrial carrier family protein [Blastocystis sp. subtype 4]|uniref:mitochondrial carrier family protein n=1 Tax=Blastocystis sp. subtype 4 TaxID=944170 RepID=UPI00071179E5|nr:mitochondrial carrier family protein [Blastocystis sp. subtype 4]KNB46222.1 mitochondrial carrier family protein [Blastocystis sp. subtype 4]|eukprot:XP_014529665.1 mitochondrial carrier family protein [Blastocystis sp. subtype 4]